MKKIAAQEVFKSAAEFTEGLIRDRLPAGAPCPALSSIENLARAANRRRQRRRPRDPNDLKFELQQDYIPDGFVKADINVGERCHILLATDAQLALLACAKTWYIDGTFKVVKHQFMHLASIHGFAGSC